MPCMNETGRDRAPGGDGATSWADETLPLALRRELLDRELQDFMATKGRAQSSAPASRSDQAPDAERPAAGKRRGERAG